MNETSDFDLRVLARKYNVDLNGIYIADKIEIIREGNTIINLNGNSHWTCVFKEKGKYIYFDSYGMPPPKHLEKLMEYEYDYNDEPIQAINSSSCGFYVIAFLKFMRGKADRRLMDLFTSFFSKEYLHNELVLKRFLNKD